MMAGLENTGGTGKQSRVAERNRAQPVFCLIAPLAHLASRIDWNCVTDAMREWPDQPHRPLQRCRSCKPGGSAASVDACPSARRAARHAALLAHKKSAA